jgi:glycosyltransferase involved in cell wall biosynthesis
MPAGAAHPPITSQPETAAVRPTLAVATARLSVALMTPWDQECGNAEYAKRLAAGLSPSTTVIPFDMRNLMEVEGDRRMPRAENARYFRDLVTRVNESEADLVHIQHEFCFFGRRIAAANRRFHDVMRSLRKPVVVSLHTWLGQMSRAQRNRLSSRWAEHCLHWQRTRQIAAALRRAEAIVLHSRDTHRQFVAAFPDLKKRVHVVPIPIERQQTGDTPASLRKGPRETWVMVPGFVSRYKRHACVLAALRHLPESFRLVAAGGVHPKDRTGGDYWMELVQQADAWGLQSRVLFTGFLSDPATQAAVLGQADVFVLPYDEVGQSGSAVLADALSYDKPVITSRARSMFVYRMDRDTAFSSIAVDVGEPEALAAEIKRCARSEAEAHPETRRHRLVAQQRHSMPNARVAYESIYRTALSGRTV